MLLLIQRTRKGSKRRRNLKGTEWNYIRYKNLSSGILLAQFFGWVFRLSEIIFLIHCTNRNDDESSVRLIVEIFPLDDSDISECQRRAGSLARIAIGDETSSIFASVCRLNKGFRLLKVYSSRSSFGRGRVFGRLFCLPFFVKWFDENILLSLDTNRQVEQVERPTKRKLNSQVRAWWKRWGISASNLCRSKAFPLDGT